MLFASPRKVFLRRSTGEAIDTDFLKLTYPDYHFYTFLLGLKVMAEGGLLADARCARALDLLKDKFTNGQGLALEKKNFHQTQSNPRRYSLVRWQDVAAGRAHALLTADALIVLRQSGRV